MEEGDGSFRRRSFLAGASVGLLASLFPNLAFAKKGYLSEKLKYVKYKDQLVLRIVIRKGDTYESISLLYTGDEKNTNKIKNFNDRNFLRSKDYLFIPVGILRNSLRQVLDENKFSIFEIASQGEEGINNLWELCHGFMNDKYDFYEKKALILILNPSIDVVRDIVYDGQEIIVPNSLIDRSLIEGKLEPELKFPEAKIITKNTIQNPFRVDISYIKTRLRDRDKFGARRVRSLGGDRYRITKHTGLDLVAPMGTPLYPIQTGVVLKTGRDLIKWRNGERVTYKADSGLIITYCHLRKDSSRKVKVGQKINLNTLIGKVGITGNASADNPHVHVQVRLGNKILDPYKYVVVDS